MAKTSKIVDAVADAVTSAEIAIVRTGRKAVGAVNRKIGGKRKTARPKTTVKRAAKKAVTRTKQAASRTKRTVRKAAKKARRSVRRR